MLPFDLLSGRDMLKKFGIEYHFSQCVHNLKDVNIETNRTCNVSQSENNEKIYCRKTKDDSNYIFSIDPAVLCDSESTIKTKYNLKNFEKLKDELYVGAIDELCADWLGQLVCAIDGGNDLVLDHNSLFGNSD